MDIDDTITYAPDFFSCFVDAHPSIEVIVVSFRTDHKQAVETLEKHHIRWDRLILSNDPVLGRGEGESLAQWKAGVINSLSPAWLFEDMPEVNCLIDPHIKVFMPCDETIRGWLRQVVN